MPCVTYSTLNFHRKKIALAFHQGRKGYMNWAELIARQVRPMHTYMHSQHRPFLETLGRVLQNSQILYIAHRLPIHDFNNTSEC